MAKGFIYILSNPAFPGLVKIGQTRQIPDGRATELFTTGVPLPFEIEFYCIVDAVEALETAVHFSLAALRIDTGREFFRITVKEAREIILGYCSPDVIWARDPTKIRSTILRKKCLRCTEVFEDQYVCPNCRTKLMTT